MLRLVANSEQFLALRYSRRLISMEKVAAWDAEVAAAHRASQEGFEMAIDRIHDLVYENFDGDRDKMLSHRAEMASKREKGRSKWV